MSYHTARTELKDIIATHFGHLTDLAAAEADQKAMKALISERADALLDNFVTLAVKRHKSTFWPGVLQSYVATILFLLSIAVFSVVLYGFGQNPLRVFSDAAKAATEQNVDAKDAKPSPSPSVTPTSSATPATP